MTDDSARATALQRRLDKNLKRLETWRTREQVTCFRVYDRDMPEAPLTLDVYESTTGQRWLHVGAWAPRHGGGGAHRALVETLVRAAAQSLGVDAAHVVVKDRDRVGGGELAGDRVEHDASGAEDAATFEVREGPAILRVELRGHLDTGLYLDHRPTRAWIAGLSRGKRMLNLFAYTAAFSVQAGVAGARSTTSVDLSPTWCRFAEHNLARNGLRGPAHAVVCDDVFAFLEQARETWDVIVLDPPSLSKSRRATRSLGVQRDHPDLIARCLDRLAPDGTLMFSNNLQSFVLSPLSSSCRVEDITPRTLPPDCARTPPAHRAWKITHAR